MRQLSTNNPIFKIPLIMTERQQRHRYQLHMLHGERKAYDRSAINAASSRCMMASPSPGRIIQMMFLIRLIGPPGGEELSMVVGGAGHASATITCPPSQIPIKWFEKVAYIQ